MEVICNIKTCGLHQISYDNYVITDVDGKSHYINKTIYNSIMRLPPNMNTSLFSFFISPNENSVRWPPIGNGLPVFKQGLLLEESKINKNLLLIK